MDCTIDEKNQFRSRFVTPDDYMNITGTDLREVLRDDGSPVGMSAADRLLFDAETELLTFIDVASFRNYKWDEISYHPDDLRSMKLAIVKQAEYMFRNGYISSDSGYDPQRGPVGKMSDIQSRAISPLAQRILLRQGLLNKCMKAMPRYPKEWWV